MLITRLHLVPKLSVGIAVSLILSLCVSNGMLKDDLYLYRYNNKVSALREFLSTFRLMLIHKLLELVLWILVWV